MAETTPRPGHADEGRLLAIAVSLNVALSGSTGVLLTLGSGVLADWFGPPAWLLAALGVGLVAFAAVLLVTLARPATLLGTVPLVIAADVAWVLGATFVVSRDTAMTAAGDTALVAVSLLVAALAVLQAAGLRRARASDQVNGTLPVCIEATRDVGADPTQVWASVSDAGAYARFADGIAETVVLGDRGHGMVRTCTDNRGDTWQEHCSLWEPGRRYRMTVDIASYPWHYRALLDRFEQTWEIEPAPGGARLTLRFDGQVKLGLIGRLAVAAMGRDGRVGRILDRYADTLAAVEADPSGGS